DARGWGPWTVGDRQGEAVVVVAAVLDREDVACVEVVVGESVVDRQGGAAALQGAMGRQGCGGVDQFRGRVRGVGAGLLVSAGEGGAGSRGEAQARVGGASGGSLGERDTEGARGWGGWIVGDGEGEAVVVVAAI